MITAVRRADRVATLVQGAVVPASSRAGRASTGGPGDDVRDHIRRRELAVGAADANAVAVSLAARAGVGERIGVGKGWPQIALDGRTVGAVRGRRRRPGEAAHFDGAVPT